MEDKRGAIYNPGEEIIKKKSRESPKISDLFFPPLSLLGVFETLFFIFYLNQKRKEAIHQKPSA
jgi:hypothetical protein